MRLELIESLIDRHSDLPFEVVFKEDLLRTGISFSEHALRRASGFKPKAYFIFSFDLVPITGMPQREHLRAPEEICLVGGPRGFRRTIVSVRLNPASPYQVDLSGSGAPVLNLEGETITGVQFEQVPDYLSTEVSQWKTHHRYCPYDRVGVSALPDGFSDLPVFRPSRGMPILRHQRELPSAEKEWASLHRGEDGRGNPGGFGDHLGD